MSQQKYSFNLTTQKDNLIYQRVHSVLSAESLLGIPDRRDAVDVVRRQSGAPTDHYNALYKHAIDQFAEFVQNIPSLRNHRVAWLDRQLNIASTVITLREPYILAGELLNRVTDHEKSLWNYTMFTGMLLSRIGDMVSQYEIALCNENGLPEHIWDPLLGSLVNEGNYYRLNKIDGTQSTFPPYHLNIASRLMPPDGLHWIMSHPDAFEQWVMMLNGEGDYDYPSMYFNNMMLLEQWINMFCPPSQTQEVLPAAKIERVIDRLTEMPSEARWELVEKRNVTERALGSQFLEWLRKKIANQTLEINKSNAHVFITREGALLINPGIFNLFKSEHALHVNRDVLRAFSQLPLVAQAQLQRYKTAFPGNPEQQVDALVIKDAKALFAKAIPAETNYVVPSPSQSSYGRGVIKQATPEAGSIDKAKMDAWPALRQQITQGSVGYKPLKK